MRSAVSFFIDFFPAVAVAGPTPPGRTGVWTWVARLRAARAANLAVLIGMTLLVGIAISIITTTDPVWWHLHFSRLGTFKNGSAAFFNGSLIAGGALTVVYAGAAAREIRALAPGRVRRGAARTTRIMYSIMGVNLSLVGCIPLNLNGFVHDRVAGAMVLGFVGLLLTSPFLLHRMPRRLLLTTALIFAAVFAGAWVFVTGQINLALFEVISFGAIFAWSGAFLGCLALVARRDAAAAAARTTAASAGAALPVAVPAAIPAAAPMAAASAAPALLTPAVAVRAESAPVVAQTPPATVSSTLPAHEARCVTEQSAVPVAPAVATASDSPVSNQASVEAALEQGPDTSPEDRVLEQSSPLTRAKQSAATSSSVADGESATEDVRVTSRSSAAPDASARVRSGRHAVPRRPRPAYRPGARRDAPVRPRRGCTASAARAVSAPSRTPDRR
jgi:hypothetical membrane protein